MFKVAIMPGHGGSDPGAENTDLGAFEKKYNWLEALEIKRILEGEGNYQVIICRDEEERVPLSEFQQRANNTHADVCLCLHHNASNEKARGWWLFYTKHQPEDEEFIKVLNQHFQELPLTARGFEYAGKPFRESWYSRVYNCIGNCQMPTVLFESCFIDNDRDCQWLMDGGYKQVAQKISDGVKEYLGEPYGVKFWSKEIDALVESGKAVTHPYQPGEAVIKLLENGLLYIKADMDTDADGSPRAPEIDPPYGQIQTSLSKDNGWRGNSYYVNAETIPYFVLPLNWTSVSGVSCKLGDLGLIRWQGKEVFAIYADEGPKNKIGEGSIKAVEALGANPWNSDKSRIVRGIPFGVEYLIFPQSTATRPIPSTFEEIQTVGREILLQTISLVSYWMTPEEMQAKSQDNDIEVWEIMNAPEFKTVTTLNCRRGIGTAFPVVAVIPADTVVKSLVDSKSQSPKVLNVGVTRKGSLWMMVEYQNQPGFVRASMRYLIPWYHNEEPHYSKSQKSKGTSSRYANKSQN